MTSPSDGNKGSGPSRSLPDFEPEIYSLQERPAGHSTESLADQLAAAPPATPPRGAATRPPAKLQSSNFWALMGCNALVFATSICIMVLELTASRLIAKHVGSSLYTWTSVIGVVLAGITVGNYIGGYLADRFTPSKTLGWLFFIASVGCFSVLWLDRLPEAVKRPDSFNWPAWVLVVVATIFLWPATVLGTISPVVASMALRRSARTGVTVGNVYAWGALGSIVGTFLTGFWLMDHFGSRNIIALTAAALAVLGAIVATGRYAFRAALLLGWLQFIGFVGLTATTTSASAGEWGLTFGELFHSNRERLPESLRQRLLNELAGDADGLEDADKRALLKFLADHPSTIDRPNVERLRAWLAGGAGLTDQARQSITKWASDSAKNAEALAWQTYVSKLGGHLHEIGLLLKLRNDNLAEYHDESNYSYINVGQREESGDLVRYLRLDKLVHSYFNPNNPTELYYDYEKVYAAVTELAVAERATEAVVRLDALPEREIRVIVAPESSQFEGLLPRKPRGAPESQPAPSEPATSKPSADATGGTGSEEPAVAEIPGKTSPEPALSGDPPRTGGTTRVAGRRLIDLPAGVTFDAEKKELRAQGGLSARAAKALLSQCRSRDWWEAVEALHAKTRPADWGGFESISLSELPEGVEIPEPLLKTVRYDHHFHALNAYGRITDADRQILLGLGPEGAFRRAVENLSNRSRKVSTFFIGGGGFVFPRWIESKFPHEPRIDVAELDPAVKLAVQRQLGLARDGRTAVNTLIGDARNVVDDRLRKNEDLVARNEPPVLYDFVYGDAFNDFSVPWHLTTYEFSDKIRRLLTKDGIYQVNLIDIYPRTMYPEGMTPNATAGYQGPLPKDFGEIKSEQWTNSAFGKELQIRRIAPNSFQFRSPGRMTDEFLTTLHGVTDENKPLNDALHRLYEDSRSARHYEGELPDALRPRSPAAKWVHAPSPYDALQMRTVDVRSADGKGLLAGSHYVLGYRGAMPADHREALLRTAPGNQPFADAVNGLYASTNRRGPGRFLGSFVRTVANIFPNVYIFSSDVGEPSDDRDTFVIVCSMTPLAMDRLQNHSDFWKGDYFAARETDPATSAPRLLRQFESVVALADGEELTDDFAPVENMLRPVFSKQR